MKKNKAIRIAVEAMKAKAQLLAVQANLYDVQGLDWPSTKGASIRRKELQEAIQVLEGMME